MAPIIDFFEKLIAGQKTPLIHDIVLQEMFHFALAGNMLSAIGGTPKIANPQFLPSGPRSRAGNHGEFYTSIAKAACWTNGASFGIALSDMINLEDAGRDLIKQGIRPDFGPAA
jgi:hypothetical protein